MEAVFSGEDWEKYSNRVEAVFPQSRPRFLEIDGKYMNLYEALTIRDKRGNNLRGRIHEMYKYLVEFRDGERITPQHEEGSVRVWLLNGVEYDEKKKYHVTVERWVLWGKDMGIFRLTPEDFKMEEVD